MSFLSKVFKYVNENGDSIEFTYENGYVINKPTGIDVVNVSVSQASGINQVGATIKSVKIQPRPVKISGKIVGEFQKQRKEKLISVIRPDLTGKLYADDYYLDVWVTATPVVSAKENFADFQFSMTAPYPYWKKDDGIKAKMSKLEYGFKFPWNLSREYRFATVSKQQFFNIQNRGQIPAPMKITLFARGRCVNPRITNVNTGKFLSIKKSMEAGERIVIDITHSRTYVTSSVDGDIRGALSLKSNLNRLDVGDNVLKPDADEGVEQLEISIDYAVEIVGVVL